MNKICLLGLFFALLCNSFVLCKEKKQQKAAKDAYRNRGNVPFFIQDPLDGTCLGPNGFTACDTGALWMFAGRKEGHSLVALLEPDTRQMCLTRTGSGKEAPLVYSACSAKGAKTWNVEPDKHGYHKVMEDGMKNCVHRTMKPYKNSVHTTSCKTAYTPLQIVETAIHDAGFFLEAADGTCFDGARFRMCDTNDLTLLWGIGVQFDKKGNGMRSLFRFYEANKCLVQGKKGLAVGDCADAGAFGWGLKDGRLSRDNRDCVHRGRDNAAGVGRCTSGFEYISLAIPENSVNNREIYMQQQHKAQLQEEMVERLRMQQQLEQYYQAR